MFGYKIENGTVRINEKEAEIVVGIFNAYLSGMSMKEAAKHSGKAMSHSSVKSILCREIYIGNEFYPAIISKNTFARARAELIKRAEGHFHGKLLKPIPIYTDFTIASPRFDCENPIEQAEYLYSLIEVRK